MLEALWAKKKEKNGDFYWLPLLQHLEDTGNIAGLLWEHWLGEGQKEFIAQSLCKGNDADAYNKQDLAKQLIVFLGAIHDLGKAIPDFQLMKGFANSKELDWQLKEKLATAGFQGLDQLVLASKGQIKHNIASQVLLANYGVNKELTTIIGSHHGKPIESLSSALDEEKSYKKNYFQSEDETSNVYRSWYKVQKEIFEWSLEKSGISSIGELPHISQPAQVILTGLLIMADWIASNEVYFPLLPIDEMDISNQEARIKEGFERWYQTGLWVPEITSNIEEIYKGRFGFSPRNFQLRVGETINHLDETGIAIVEAPMGIGKTEAALVLAEQMAHKNHRNGIFFGLPTQATSNGIFPRIEQWIEALPNDFDDRHGLRLAHGKAYLNDRFINLVHIKEGMEEVNNATGVDIDNDKYTSEQTVVINEWFSGRKLTTLDDFVVGTIDQFLMVSLKQKHVMLRHLGFSKKVVILDEVHAYDTYMNQYLMQSLKWMGAYHVPVVILSATLPVSKRKELIESYMIGKGIKKKDIDYQCQIETEAYPLLTYNDGDMIKQQTDFEVMADKSIQIEAIDEQEIIPLLENLLREGGIAGVIVNTVRRAQELTQRLEAIFGHEVVELLHSGFIATDRAKKEKQLLEMIGKGAKRSFKKIIVGTQVIEQSLDIDFDVLISDLAPIDLLIQRVGRLHRHMIHRPKALENPFLYVLGTSEQFDFDEGSKAVYGTYLLGRTQYYLKDCLKIPSDISPLVQAVYGFERAGVDEDIQLSSVLREVYQKAKVEYVNDIDEKIKKAGTYRIKPPIYKTDKDLEGWLSDIHPNQTEEYACAQVRDTGDSVEVIALQENEVGYSYFGEREDLSQQLVDTKVAKEMAKHTLRLPIMLCQSYIIDTIIKELEIYNNEKLKSWQTSSWLKGQLGIIFDRQGTFLLKTEKGDFKLFYSTDYGLRVIKLDKEE